MDVEADGKLHMLYLGLLTEAKGIYDLLDVVKDGLDDYNGRLILHVGGNGEVEQLQKVIEEARLEDVVKYEGWLDGERKSRLMNLCCVYVLPSYHEGLPVSILEAMSYGEYIVSTKVGGIPEVVGKDVGVLINPGYRKALKDVLDSIVCSRITAA
jgi:glycosyltransferase involved in cell wall biosynthesis